MLTQKIIRVVRRGKYNSRVQLEDGSTTLLANIDPELIAFREGQVIATAVDAKTFGIEFECLIPQSKIGALSMFMRRKHIPYINNQGEYRTSTYDYWTLARDGSLSSARGYKAVELKSRVLSFDSLQDIEEVKTVLEYLNHIGCRVNYSCGTHVHLGGFTCSAKLNEKLYFAYGEMEEALFDRVVSPSRRANNNTYCRPCGLNAGESFVEQGRYHKYNPRSLQTHGTIEFRQHQGTLCFRKIMCWADLCRGWLKYASVAINGDKVPFGNIRIVNDVSIFDVVNELKDYISEETRAWVIERYEDFR